jgi:PAS domain S-box-containing protein
MADLAAMRERFLTTGQVAEGVRPLVWASWARCRAYGLDPHRLPQQSPDPAALGQAQTRSQYLLAIADPFLRGVHETLGDQPHLVSLANSEGVIIRLLADPMSRTAGTASNLFEGACWDERACGCNGAGTALATGQPVVLIGPEHFMDDYITWTCVGIPLHNRGGGLVGALDLSVPNDYLNIHTWGWMLSIGQAIEAALAAGGGPDGQAGAAMPDLDNPFQVLRGAADLLTQHLPVAPTHAHVLAESRASIEQAAAQRRQLLDHVARREEQFRSLFETMAQGVVYQDAQGHITAANRAAERLLGLTLDQLQSRTSHDPRWRAVREDGRDFPGEEHPAMVALQTGEPVHDVVMGIFSPADARQRWICVNAIPQFRPGETAPYQVYTTLEDITARKEAEAERARLLEQERHARAEAEQAHRDLDQAYALLDTLFATAPIGLGFWDRELRFVRLNDALAEINGLPLEAHLGKTPRQLLPNLAGVEQIEDDWRRILASGEPVLNVEVSGETPAAPGEMRYWVESWYPVRVRDEIIGIGAVVEEVTARKRLEADRRALERAREEFFAVAAHDLKTPLTAIKGYSQLQQRRARVLSTPEGASVAAALRQIETLVNEATSQINGLLDVARLQTDQPLTLERGPVDLVQLARDQVTRHAGLGTGHTIRLRATPQTLVGMWDGQRLERMLSNLLSNAIKYSPEGGTITVTLRREDETTEPWAVLAVRDTGIGIPPAEVDRVFERYFRATNVQGHIGGTGIGLAGVKQTVDQHRGTVAVTSRQGRGTTFTVRLPLMMA